MHLEECDQPPKDKHCVKTILKNNKLNYLILRKGNTEVENPMPMKSHIMVEIILKYNNAF